MNEIAKENRDNFQLAASVNNHFAFMFAMLADPTTIESYVKITKQAQINEICDALNQLREIIQEIAYY